MDTKTITLDVPSDILLAINETEGEFKKRLKLDLAIRLYKSQKLTLGKASELAGLSRIEFENILAENEVPISLLSSDDIIKDVNKIRE